MTQLRLDLDADRDPSAKPPLRDDGAAHAGEGDSGQAGAHDSAYAGDRDSAYAADQDSASAADHASAAAADHASACFLVQELERIARTGGRTRTLLIVRTRGEGKELLRQVALRGRSWMGFEITTLRPLATKIAARSLARAGRTVIDAFDEHALVERAIDEVIGAGPGGAGGNGGRQGRGRRSGDPRVADVPFGELAEKTGFRDAVRKSVSSLRNAGVVVRGDGRGGASTGEQVGARRGRGKGALVIRVLARYEALLRRERRADTATVLRAATRVLRDGAPGALPTGGRILIVPGLPSRGLEGRLLAEIRKRDAVLLRADPVEGLRVPKEILWDVGPPKSSRSYLHAVGRCAAELPPPGEGAAERIEIFAAASIYDELRGVLRRALEMGARWDEVEIVAADPDAYGSALHAIAAPLGVPVNFAVGLPVERTRPGRVVATYFRWIESGFQESLVRALIEAGDVEPPRARGEQSAHRRSVNGPRLARALRRLRIGWGRDRHLGRIDRALENVDSLRRGRFDDAEALERRKKRAREELRALRAILGPVLSATPSTDGRVSPGEVAGGAKSVLASVVSGTETDETARQRLLRQLERIEATVKRPTDFASASAIVQSYLQIRIPAPRTEGLAPWSSTPGHVYMTDLRHGGATGRRFTFIVGLDARSVTGSLHEDPLIGDEERFRLGRGDLPLASERAAEARFNFAQLFARLRGTVVASFARWDPAESRELAPAPEMLQALRLRERDQTLTFEDLTRHMAQTESRLPRPDLGADVDGSDVWMRALTAPGGGLRDGVDAIARSFPRLGAGQALSRALASNEPSVHTGFLGTHTPPLSYQNTADQTFSPSGLETLGACPRRFLFRHVLKASPPDDPEFDPGRWLNALERGGLLHAVYESTLRDARGRGIEPGDDRFMELVLAHVDRMGEVALVNTPAPSEALHGWEMEALRDDARSFVAMIRREGAPWKDLEWQFGVDEETRIEAGSQSVLVRGVVDRVDDHDLYLRVIDYKTGSDYKFGGKTKVYNGGRRLQHFVYSAAVAALTGKPVLSMEYHFPTRRGENRVYKFGRLELKHGGRLVETLLRGVAHGWFPATDNAKDDCRFCDYQAVCGVESAGFSGARCDVSDWTKRNLGNLDELVPLRKARNWTESEPRD